MNGLQDTDNMSSELNTISARRHSPIGGSFAMTILDNQSQPNVEEFSIHSLKITEQVTKKPETKQTFEYQRADIFEP